VRAGLGLAVAVLAIVGGIKAPAAPQSPRPEAAFFEPPAGARAGRALTGRVRLTGVEPRAVSVLRDDFGILEGERGFRLPPFDFAYAGDGQRLVPLDREPVGGAGQTWEYLLSPGWTWRNPGATANTALLPFSLFECNANCLHYGLLRFEYAGDVLGCNGPLWIPFMAGYGSIVLALFPNGTSYYYVSDGGALRWRNAALASHRIRPMCDAEASTDE